MSNLGPQFDRAQTHHDNLMPEPDPPEPVGAVPCICGADEPYWASENQSLDGAICVRCNRCQRAGPWKYGMIEAVEAWNERIAQWRKDK